VGGWVRHGRGETASYRPRPVVVLQAASAKVYERTVELPAALPLDGGMPQEPEGRVGSDAPSAGGRGRPLPLDSQRVRGRGVRSNPGEGVGWGAAAGSARGVAEDFWRPFIAA